MQTHALRNSARRKGWPRNTSKCQTPIGDTVDPFAPRRSGDAIGRRVAAERSRAPCGRPPLRMARLPEAKRSQKAAKKAYQAVKKVDINSSDYYNSVGRIMTTYISDKLNRSVAGLSQAELSGLLLAQGVDNNLVGQVRTCLTISEIGQYAPIHQMNPKEVHLETKSLIAELEKIL